MENTIILEVKVSTLFENSFLIADLMFKASSTPTYVTLMKADSSGYNVESILTRWAGGTGENPESVLYGSWMAYTLLAKGEKEGISKTPIPNFPHGCPYEGGLREDDYIVSCSAWSNHKVDLILSALLMYCLHNDVRFHHAGFSYPSESECVEATARCMTKFTSKSIPLHFSDTKRWFVKVHSKLSPNGKFWIEHLYSTRSPSCSLHWDIATSDPKALIDYISEISGIEPVNQQEGKDSLLKKIVVQETDGTEIAIMARPNWNTIKYW